MSEKKNIAFITFGFLSILICACGPSDEKIISDARKLAISDFRNHEIRFYSQPDSLFGSALYVKSYFNKFNMNVEFLRVDYCGNASNDDVHFMKLKAYSYNLKMDSILCDKYGKGYIKKIQKYCDSAFLFDKQKITEKSE